MPSIVPRSERSDAKTAQVCAGRAGYRSAAASLVLLWAAGCGGGGSSGDDLPAGGASGDAGTMSDAAGSAPADAEVRPDGILWLTDARPGPGTQACASAVDLNTEAVGRGSRWIWAGSSTGGPADQYGSCGGNGREMAFRFTAPEPGEYRFSTRGEDPDLPVFDTIVYARRICTDPESELACDNGAEGSESTVVVPLADGETISVFVDAYGPGTGGRFELAVSLRGPAGEGEPCDPAEGPSACAPELRCLTVDAVSACLRAVAPMLTAGTLVFNPVAGALGLRISGLDPSDDVVALNVSLFDADGADVSLGLGRGPFTLPFTALQQGGGAFEGELSLVLPTDRPAVARAAVAAVDAAALASEVLELEAVLPPAVAAGAACDDRRAFDVCAEGLLCDDGVCATAVAACPPAFAARPLAVGLEVEGTLALARPLGHGRCGGVAGDDVHTFTAVTAGLHAFEVRGADRDATPVLFARSHCGAEDVAAALGCATADAARRARLVLDLAAGEIVYLFVDTTDPEWAGTYFLRGWQPAPPTLGDAVVFANPEASVLGFALTGVDPDGDIRAFAVRLFDADGADLLGETGPLDLRLTAGESTPAGQDEVVIRSVRFLDLDARRIARVEVGLVDAVGGRSDVRSVVPRRPPTVARGQACDAEAAFAVCGATDRCRGVEGEGPNPEGTCQEVRVECPLAYGEVVDLNAPAVQQGEGLWRYDGDTTGGPNLTGGTCGGGDAREVSHRFVAPAEGTYVFRTTVEAGRDTVLYLRSLCGEAGSESELACNDDAGETPGASAVSVTLRAGEVVFALVDGFPGGEGPYSLWVESGGAAP